MRLTDADLRRDAPRPSKPRAIRASGAGAGTPVLVVLGLGVLASPTNSQPVARNADEPPMEYASVLIIVRL